jgi:O-antigen/teichoic acid export membrane protein
MSVAVLVVGFLVQKIFIDTLGLEYLGVNGLFTNIITMLGIVELGLGAAIVYHLYKPLADGDTARVKSLLFFYKNGYRVIALVVTVIGLSLIPFLPAIVGEITISTNTTAVYLLFLTDVVLSYFLAYKRSLLYADQKNYVINLVHLTSVAIMNVVQIAALVITKNFYLYLLIRIVMRIVENLAINAIVNRRYKFINQGTTQPLDTATKQDIFQKIRALFMHKIGTFIVLGSDNIIIAVFLGIATVGLYSNYYLAVAAISMIIGQIFTAITASIGNLLISSNAQKSYAVYKNIRFANFWLATVAATGMLVAMDSFVVVWLGQNYVLTIGVLAALSINLYLQLTRSATNSFKEAAGIFHQDRFVPLIESFVNIVLSIVFLHYFGLAGVIIGTVCSNLVLHLFSYPRYVYTKLFERRYADYYLEFFRYIFIATLVATGSFIVSRLFYLSNDIANLALNVAVALILPNVMLYLIFKKNAELTYFRKIFAQTFNTISRQYIGKKR